MAAEQQQAEALAARATSLQELIGSLAPKQALLLVDRCDHLTSAEHSASFTAMTHAFAGRRSPYSSSVLSLPARSSLLLSTRSQFAPGRMVKSRSAPGRYVLSGNEPI